MQVVEIIQSMLAPGIMISACGLLLLGMNNKYSLVVNRIRSLDEEKRNLNQLKNDGIISPDKQKRLNSLNIQTIMLAYRIKLVRNAVICYSMAVAFFIITCLTIGLSYIRQNVEAAWIVIFFLVGMLSVLAGIIYACHEAFKGYDIIRIEIEES
jgi:hypothetical protein